MAAEKRLFLFDAYALIYRAYYAFINSQMYSSKGFNTSTTFGFLLALEDVIRNQNPTHIIVGFDTSTPTFRHEMYKEYKAHRPASPEEIHSSVPVIKEILGLMNIQIIEYPGFEADDVIGTLAVKASNAGFNVFMVTPDKDYCQLVTDKVKIYKPGKAGSSAEIMGIDEVLAKFEIKDTAQVIDILALWGDASDNIPGVPGIGEKTAKKLISEFNSVENLLNNLDKLSGKQKLNFETNIENLHLSKKLVTICTDVPIEFNENECFVKEFSNPKLLEKFNELNFKTLINRFLKVAQTPVIPKQATGPVQGSLFDMGSPNIEPIAINTNLLTSKDVEHIYKLLHTESEIVELIKVLETLTAFCFDTETTGLNPYTDKLIGIAISFKKFEAFYIPISLDGAESKRVLALLKPVLENERIVKIGQNLKFDILFLKSYGIEVKGKLFDTMLAHYLLQPEQNHKMDVLAEKYLNYKPISIEELIGKKGVSQLNMKDIAVEKVAEYSGEDADVTLQLKEVLEKEIDKNSLTHLYYDIESRLLEALIYVESNGFTIDTEYLVNYNIKLTNDIQTVEDEIIALAGQKFNIASPKQLGEILFEKLAIPYEGKLTKTKQYSTAEEQLQYLTEKHPIINKILDYRSLTKLQSTYVEALPLMVNKITGKIHTTFNQTLAVTGRLSSINPNLQNIPMRGARGREIRNAFIPSGKDYTILSADYSQIELRVMAHFCKDELMMQAYFQNLDIHASTASKIFKVPLEDVTKDQRSSAKTANFGIIYGISAFGLSQRLNIPRKEAADLIDEYFKSFPNVKKYMVESIAFAREHGYVETLLKRRRYLPDINSQNANIRGMAERNAINSPVQGTAADIIKLAMVKIYDEIRKRNLKSKMILQVHDELVFDVFLPELEEMKILVKENMENAMKLDVPLLVEIGIGNTWLQAH